MRTEFCAQNPIKVRRGTVLLSVQLYGGRDRIPSLISEFQTSDRPCVEEQGWTWRDDALGEVLIAQAGDLSLCICTPRSEEAEVGRSLVLTVGGSPAKLLSSGFSNGGHLKTKVESD